jgi:polyisoprenoid-binding protein YceI
MYRIDKTHSEAVFQVRHLITKVRGRFSDFEGTIAFDAEAPEHSSVTFTVQTSSIDTNSADRDAHLRSDDFFGVERFPTLTFVSTAITKTSDDEFAVEGDLTIRDTTRRVTLPVTYLGKARDPWGSEKLAFETEITINRKDYGLLWNAALETGGFLVGDDVKINVSVQAAASA